MEIASVTVYSISRDWIKGQVTTIETGILTFEGGDFRHATDRVSPHTWRHAHARINSLSGVRMSVVTSTTPYEYGSACWARTNDPLINSQLLYQLS